MRANLPHALRQRRPSRRRTRRRDPGETVASARTSPALDRALELARDAGGPVDQASYICECGYVFVAAVSTTVSCPQCDARQVW